MMKTRFSAIAIAVALLVASGWFAGRLASAAQGTSTGTASGNQESAMVDPMQIARGAQLWIETCRRCHNLRSPDEFSDKSWDIIVNHMRVIAPLPGRDAADIKAFLRSSN